MVSMKVWFDRLLCIIIYRVAHRPVPEARSSGCLIDSTLPASMRPTILWR
jgi:hypothetical protein